MGKQNSLTKSDDGEELDINPTFSRRVMTGRKESRYKPSIYLMQRKQSTNQAIS